MTTATIPLGAQILRDLGVRGMRLLTNNQREYDGIANFGLYIRERVPLIVTPQRENAAYLLAKQVILGHMLGFSGETGQAQDAKAEVGCRS